MVTTAAREPMTPAVRLTVFGGLRLYVHGTEVDIGPPRQRSILAMLVAARGDTVTLAELTEVLWSNDAPASSANQIHRHVGNLRRILESDLPTHSPGSFVLPRGNGYALDISRIDSEIERFFALASEGSRSRVLALALATAPPFAGLPDDVLALPSVGAIQQARAAVAIAAVGSVDGGETSADELLPSLTLIAANDPLNERLQASLMRLFQLAGRRSDAIELYDRTRKLLVRELGIDPGPELIAAHLSIVSDESADERFDSTTTPRELPPVVLGFVDRPNVQTLLFDATTDALDGAGSISVLSGMGGIGKTTLAVHWATSVAHQFPDGQLYLNLLGFDPNLNALSPDEALNRLLDQLGSTKAISNSSERAAHFRRLMAGKRIILLLDNAKDADQVRPLLSADSRCLTIVTSRNRLAGLIVREGARSIPLGRWGAAESRELLARRLGTERAVRESGAVSSIATSCAGLPLALAIAAARAALLPDSAMAAMADHLAERSLTLDSLSASADDDIRSTFEWSYRALEPEVARMFRHLGAHPGPQMSIWSLATCAQRSLTTTRRLLGALVIANMANEIGTDRFEIHDLLRVYADELLDSAGERTAAEERIVEHYVRSTREAFLQFGRPPTVDLQFHEPSPESIERFNSMAESLTWYSRERSPLVASISKAVKQGLDRQAALIALDWRPMNQSLDTSEASLDSCQIAYAAALRTGDLPLIADLARDVGAKLSKLHRFSEADEHFMRALRSFESLGDAVGESNVYRNLSSNAGRRSHPGDQLTFAQRSVETARRTGRHDVLATALSELGWVLMDTKDSTAEGVLLEALEHAQAAELDYQLSPIVLDLALISCEQGEYSRALEWLSTAHGYLQDNSDPALETIMWATQAIASSHLLLVEPTREGLVNFDRLLANHREIIDHLVIELVETTIVDVEAARAWVNSLNPSVDAIDAAT